MKKVYIAPSIEIVECETTTMIASSLPDIGNAEDSKGGMEGDANSRRGEWGNLWEDSMRW
jgi:hypothetical protein